MLLNKITNTEKGTSLGCWGCVCVSLCVYVCDKLSSSFARFEVPVRPLG